MTAPELVGWTPIRIYWRDDEPMVDWCHLGEERFVSPFFEQTIVRCLRHPFGLLFRHQTPIAALNELDTAHPGVPPAGFVFHMSRCGSTLVGQMMATSPEHIVISEAGPIDTVLRSHLRDPRISDEQRIAWLRGLVSAFGQRRSTSERRLYVKFDSWSVFELPLIHRAFPDVPWVFIYREPVEVLMSHTRERGSQMIPGVLQPELLGLDRANVSSLSLDEYTARVLAAVCESAVQHHRLGAGKLVNYAALPSVVWTDVCPFFGTTCTSDERDRMQDAARFHGKRPYEPFEQDSGVKQQAASTRLRALAARWLDPLYDQLEALRLGAPSTDERSLGTSR